MTTRLRLARLAFAHGVARWHDGPIVRRLPAKSIALGAGVRVEARVTVEVVVGHIEQRAHVGTEGVDSLHLEARDFQHHGVEALVRVVGERLAEVAADERAHAREPRGGRRRTTSSYSCRWSRQSRRPAPACVIERTASSTSPQTATPFACAAATWGRGGTPGDTTTMSASSMGAAACPPRRIVAPCPFQRARRVAQALSRLSVGCDDARAASQAQARCGHAAGPQAHDHHTLAAELRHVVLLDRPAAPPPSWTESVRGVGDQETQAERRKHQTISRSETL